MIDEHTGDAQRLFVNDFSTTGPVERVASQIVMMEAFQKYFDFVVKCICGIPSVTLEGAPSDWEKIRARVDEIGQYDDLEWWLKFVRSICDQFVRAANGDVDRRHWRRIYKIREVYGGHVMNGWICRLIPYVKEDGVGLPRTRNPLLTGDDGISSHILPNGVSLAPFTLVDGNRSYSMEFIGGFVGVTQDKSSLALRPKIGWCVYDKCNLQDLIERVKNEHLTHEPDIRNAGRICCGELRQFYLTTNGAELFKDESGYACRILPATGLTPIESDRRVTGYDMSWIRICNVSEGGFFAMNASSRKVWDSREHLWFVYYCPEEFVQGRPFAFRFVATSFSKFLKMLLDSNGQLMPSSGPSLYIPERRSDDMVAVSYSRKMNDTVEWNRTDFPVEERIDDDRPHWAVWFDHDIIQQCGSQVLARIAVEPVLMCEREELRILEREALVLKEFLSKHPMDGPAYQKKWPKQVDRLLNAVARAKLLTNGGVFVG
jgi:hypothetical protein